MKAAVGVLTGKKVRAGAEPLPAEGKGEGGSLPRRRAAGMTGPTGRPVPTRRPVRAGPAIRSVSFARYEESDAGHDRRDALDDGFRVAGLLWCRSLGPVQTARPVQIGRASCRESVCQYG